MDYSYCGQRFFYHNITYIDGLAQNCANSSVLAREKVQCFSTPVAAVIRQVIDIIPGLGL